MTPQPKPTKPVRTAGMMIRTGSGSHRTYGNLEFEEGDPDIDTYDQEWMRHSSEDFGGM